MTIPKFISRKMCSKKQTR